MTPRGLNRVRNKPAAKAARCFSLMSLLLIKLGHIPESIAGIELPLPSPISGANFLASFYLPVSPNTQPTPTGVSFPL